MIIQCPSCTTKFAIEAATVDELEAPRFHCSRCDNVFNFDDAPPSIRPIEEPRAPQSRGEAGESTREPSLDSRGGGRQLPLPTRALQIPAPLGIGHAIRPPHEDFHPHESAGFEHSEHNSSSLTRSSHDEERQQHSSQPWASLSEAYFSEEVSDDRGPSYGNLSQEESSAGWFADETTHGNSSGNISGTNVSDTAVLPVSFAPMSPRESISHAPATTLRAAGEAFPSPINKPQAFTFPGLAFVKSLSERRRQRQLQKSIAAPREKSARENLHISAQSGTDSTRRDPALGRLSGSRWAGLLTLALPICAFFILLGIFTALPWIAPSASIEITRQLFPAAPQVAPPGLFLKNMKFRIVTLETGERAALITGSILNESTTNIREAKIEGALFDASGRPLILTRVSASSPLARGRIRSLTPELIRSSQNARTPSDFMLRSGSNQDFALVMMSETGGLVGSRVLDQAKHFSARVFSVNF